MLMQWTIQYHHQYAVIYQTMTTLLILGMNMQSVAIGQ